MTNLKAEFFGDADNNVVGRTVKFNNIPFTVIGVIQKPSKNIYNWHGNSALIPYSAYTELFGDQNIRFFMVLPDPKANPKIVEQTMRSYFAYKYNFAPDDKVALSFFNTTEMYQFMRWFFIGIQIFLGICGSLALGVGSLGVANIMFLIVVERTREIGLRLAIGASDWHILFQIILEALIIIALGGAVGFLLSYITISVLQLFTLPEWLGAPAISSISVIVTLVILAILGVLAGYFPARRASKMDPVEALGH